MPRKKKDEPEEPGRIGPLPEVAAVHAAAHIEAAKAEANGTLKPAPVPKYGSMGATCVALFGGEKGFCEFLVKEIKEAKKGSMYRARLLEFVLSTVRFQTERESPQEEYGLISTEDLEKIVAEDRGGA